MVRRTMLGAVAILAVATGLSVAALIQGGHQRNERITGTSKVDRILAGRGNDVVFARDRRRDFVNCGPGYDRAVLDRIDRALGCEVRRYPPTTALVVPMPPPNPAVYAGKPGTVTPLPKPRPKPAPTPAPPETIPLGQLFGLVANSDHERAIESAWRLKVELLRMEFAIDELSTTVERLADLAGSRGIELIPQAGFENRIPSTTEARHLGTWARELQGKVRWIEFGNETGYRHQGTFDQGGAYCRAAAAALEAMNGSGVGLLVQADDGNTGSGWIGDCAGAAPAVVTGAAGWTIHPYGPRDRWEPRLARVETELGAVGVPAAARLFVTEWGVSSDNGAALSDNYGFPVNLTYAQAGDAIRSNVTAMLARFPRIAVFTDYQAHDQLPSGTGQREHYFGALRSDQSDKPGLSDDVRYLAGTYRG